MVELKEQALHVLYVSGWNERGANKNNESEEAFCENKGICLAPE